MTTVYSFRVTLNDGTTFYENVCTGDQHHLNVAQATQVVKQRYNNPKRVDYRGYA